MNDKTLVEMLAGWSDSEFAVVASGEYCEDLKSRIEGDLAKQADTIETLQARIEALEAALRRIKDATDNEMRAGDKGYVSRYGIHGIATKALESQP